jgi:hypothetical protein
MDKTDVEEGQHPAMQTAIFALLNWNTWNGSGTDVLL